MKVPSGGIPARSGLATGSANCDLFQLDDSGTIEPVRKPNGQGVRIIARNPSAQRIRGPVSNYEGDQYLSVTYDGNRSWIIDPAQANVALQASISSQGQELGDGSRTAICQRSLGTDRSQGRGLQRL